MGIIVFDGGPLNGQAYETRDLLGAPSLNLPEINKYKWTSEKRISEKTGASAQVWRYDAPTPPGQAAPTPPPGQSPGVPVATEPPQFSAPQPDAAPVAQPVAADGPADAIDAATHAEADADAVSSPATLMDEMTAAATAPVVGELDMTNLLERRKALKVSRGEVSTRCGLAQSKIDTIENNKPGKRVTDEERATLAACIAQLEQERAASAH